MRISTHVGIPGYDLLAGGHATLNLNFVDANRLDPQITFTRASTATFFNSSGVLTSAGNNVARLDYNPTTLAARGLLIEEQRTNSIRNNTMQGAVAGTPGTLPTNWAQTNLAAGLTREIVGTGTANGLNYIDIRISGTTADANGWNINTDANTQIAASSGQVWTGSFYIAVVGGSTANMTGTFLRVIERSGAGAYVAETAISWGTATSTLVSGRFTATRTMGATTGFAQLGMYFSANSGVAIDITLRIGLPQLEQGAFATSVIPTSGTALTRNADVASVNTLSPWYNSSEGTIYAEAFNVGASTFRLAAEGADGSTFRDFSLGFDGSLSRANFTARYQTGNFDVFSPNSSITANTFNKLAGSYSASSSDLAYNGLLSTNKAAVTQRIPADRMFIGSRTGASTFLNGWLRRITYYPRRLSNSELQAITA